MFFVWTPPRVCLIVHMGWYLWRYQRSKGPSLDQSNDYRQIICMCVGFWNYICIYSFLSLSEPARRSKGPSLGQSNNYRKFNRVFTTSRVKIEIQIAVVKWGPLSLMNYHPAFHRDMTLNCRGCAETDFEWGCQNYRLWIMKDFLSQIIFPPKGRWGEKPKGILKRGGDAINKIGRDGVYGIYAPVQKAMRREGD